MGPIWGRQDPGGPHVGPMNFAIWDHAQILNPYTNIKAALLNRFWTKDPMSSYPIDESFIHLIYVGNKDPAVS